MYTVTKQPDGDVNFGNWNGELVTLQPSTSDYTKGTGYPLYDGVSAVNNPGYASSQNVDLYRLQAMLPAANQGGFVPVLNTAVTPKRVNIYEQNGSTGPLQEVATGTDLSAYSFSLLLMGI